MARVAYAMAIGSKWVKAEIIDAQVFWTEMRKYKVGPIPRTFFNGGESFVGVETEGQMLERLLRAAGGEE